MNLAIAQNDGEVLYRNGYGWANEEKQISVTSDTIFWLDPWQRASWRGFVKVLDDKFPQTGEAVLDTPILES